MPQKRSVTILHYIRTCACTYINNIVLFDIEGNLRLRDDRLPSNELNSIGRLEIYMDGRWGTICGNQFSWTEADVACRQLGFNEATNFSFGFE